MTGSHGDPADTARRLLTELVGAGVREIVLSPGSRSAPVAFVCFAAAQAGLVRLHVRVDEREAGFLALGLAKASRRLVPVVTTSGTAVANLHPALLEAQHAGVGVLAVTADRPARLRGTGANQTTVQPGIFPGVAFAADVEALGGVLDSILDAGRDAQAPAHLNLELDEPLVGEALPDAPDVRPVDEIARATPPAAAGHELARGPRTVVVAGDDAGPRARVVAQVGGWPLLAEPTSGARTGEALPSYRLLLGLSDLTDDVERVISFGHPTLSRPVTRLLARSDVEVVHVGTAATFPLPADERVRLVSDVHIGEGPVDHAWRDRWRRADRATGAAVERVRVRHPGSGLDVAATVARSLAPGGLLLVGASQPIRDLDLVAPAWPVGEHRLVIANRGLAGIDGTLSTAVGAALARPGRPATALMGDLTFLHGSNGLLIGPDEPVPDLTVVVVNDDGGAIFSTLEQGAEPFAAAFERVFATPTGADLGALCAATGVAHRRVDVPGLARALEEPVAGIRVLEVPVTRDRRRALEEGLRAAGETGL